jgi:Fe(3+) dicitrate transport protein
MKGIIIALTTLFTVTLSSQEKPKELQKASLDSIQKLDEIILSTNVIFGNKYVAKHRTGSAY